MKILFLVVSVFSAAAFASKVDDAEKEVRRFFSLMRPVAHRALRLADMDYSVAIMEKTDNAKVLEEELEGYAKLKVAIEAYVDSSLEIIDAISKKRSGNKSVSAAGECIKFRRKIEVATEFKNALPSKRIYKSPLAFIELEIADKAMSAAKSIKGILCPWYVPNMMLDSRWQDLVNLK